MIYVVNLFSGMQQHGSYDHMLTSPKCFYFSLNCQLLIDLSTEAVRIEQCWRLDCSPSKLLTLGN